MKPDLVNDVPTGLTLRARSFVGVHGVKVDVRPVEENRQWCLERGIPAAVIDRMAAYQKRWPKGSTALIYSGLDAWGLHGGVRAGEG